MSDPLKAFAFKVKEATGVSHGHALELIAAALGCSTYAAYTMQQPRKPMFDVEWVSYRATRLGVPVSAGQYVLDNIKEAMK